MIRILTVGEDFDRDSAFALHSECFGDEREWFDALCTAASGEKYIAFQGEGGYIGGTFLFDVFLGGFCGKYVYALGVSENHRGKGIAKKLLECAKEVSKDFTLICPADEGLAKAYERLGFCNYVGGTVNAGDLCGADMDISAYVTPCTSKSIVGGFLLRERLFDFALCECSAELLTDGESVIASSAAGVYAAYGKPARISKKAQVYLKNKINIDGAIADLILET